MSDTLRADLEKLRDEWEHGTCSRCGRIIARRGSHQRLWRGTDGQPYCHQGGRHALLSATSEEQP